MADSPPRVTWELLTEGGVVGIVNANEPAKAGILCPNLEHLVTAEGREAFLHTLNAIIAAHRRTRGLRCPGDGSVHVL